MKNTKLFSGTIALTLIIALLTGQAPVSAAEKQENKTASVNFVAFDDAEYHTSPDKRIGAKILVDPSKVGPSIATLVHLTYLPGAHIGSHRHVFVTEIINVLEGNLTLRIGDEIKILGPNSTAFIPAKSFHEYLNDSTDVVKFLQYYSPSGPEEEYRNWTKPAADEAAAVKAAPEKKEEAKHVVAQPLPTVPGSPTEVKLGGVVEKPAEPKAEPKKVEDKDRLSLSSQPPSIASAAKTIKAVEKSGNK